MSDLLQTIKDQVCVDLGYKSFEQMYGYNNVFFVKQFYEEFCKRYALEVAKASLKKASEKVTPELGGYKKCEAVPYCWNNPDGSNCGCYMGYKDRLKNQVDNESNIVL